MAGSENITAKSTPDQVSLWVRDAIARLKALAGSRSAVNILETCGTNCARVNHTVIDRAKVRRQKYRSESEFLAAEQRKPQTGTWLELDGNTLYQIYTPQEFTRPIRCYCALLRGLPEGESISQIYCHCSKAFVKTFWEEVLGRPLAVEVLETAVTGSKECKPR